MDVDEREANTIVVFLASKGIKAEKVMQAATTAGGENTQSRFTIDVDSSLSTKAMAYLNQNGLPRIPSSNLLTIFAKSGLMSSSSEELIRYQAGLSEQIAGTIRRIDGVLDAQVQIAFPKEETGITTTQAPQKVTAAVYVKHQGILDDPNSHLIAKIKRLVAASVTGLDINDVNVIPDRSRFLDLSLTTSPEMVSGSIIGYSQILGIKVAQESVSTFQNLFFTLLSMGILFFMLALLLIWKAYPILKSQGFYKLFSLEPFSSTSAELPPQPPSES